MLYNSYETAMLPADTPIISPDGRRVVFAARAIEDGQRRLWVRELDSFEARPLPETDKNLQATPCLFWCEDSRRIGYHADGKLWSIDLDGAAPRFIANIHTNFGATWNRDDIILLAPGEGGLLKVSARGGEMKVITSPNANLFEVGHIAPHFLPDGNRFLFLGFAYNPSETSPKRNLYSGRLDSQETVVVTSMNSAAMFAEPGVLFYVEGGSVKAAPFDDHRMRVTGRATTLIDQVFYFQPIGFSSLSVSRNGILVYTPVASGDQLVWFDDIGRRLDAIGEDYSFSGPTIEERVHSATFRISPDGIKVAAAVNNIRTGVSDIRLFDLDRGTSSRLTSDTRWENMPTWSRDGKRLYFSWDPSGPPDVYSLSIDGSDSPELTYGAPGSQHPRDVSPDGQWLLIDSYSFREQQTNYDIGLVSLKDPNKVVPHDIGKTFLRKRQSKADSCTALRSSAQMSRWRSLTWTG